MSNISTKVAFKKIWFLKIVCNVIVSKTSSYF